MVLSRLTFNGWPILPLLALLAVLQIVAPSRVWMTLLVGLGATLAISWAWARQMQDNVHLTREKRYHWTRVGDRLEERFTLYNHSFLPVLWAEVNDASTLPGYHPGGVTGVDSYGTNRWINVGVCQRRGVFNLGPTTLRLGDPFGLFSAVKHYPATVPLLVVPATLTLPGIQVASGGNLTEGRPRPYASEPTSLASSVRPYTPGDSLRLVHWPTSARRDSWFVRTFDGSPAGAWWVILDLAQDGHSGEGNDSTLEQGITLAASLAEMGLQAHRPVGFVAHGAEPVWLPPQPDENQRWAILRTLATIKAGVQPLTALLQRAGGTLRQAASLIIITPAVDAAWLDPLLLLRQRGLVPTVMLLTGQTEPAQVTVFYELLLNQGITTYLMEPDTLAQAATPASGQGHWVWRVTPLGRAVAIHRPQGDWEALH